MRANYHTHTYRCRHAKGTEREYIETAIEAGLLELGFSDHAAYPFIDGHTSSFRMALDEADGYFETLSRLKKEYKDRIRIYSGFEAEYYPESFGELLKLVRSYPCDYLIMGQHFLENEVTHLYSGERTEDETYLAKYVNQVIEGLKTGVFTYLAHPDLPDWGGDEETYRRQMLVLCQEAKRLDIPLEINFLGIETHRVYPRESFWKLVGEVGNRVVLGCDAHEARCLNLPEIEAEALALAARYGLKPEETLTLKKP